MGEPRRPSAALRPALAAGVALLIAAWALAGIFLPGRDTTVFSGDIGVKYMQVRALVSGRADVDGLRDPIDSDGRFFPLRSHFAFQANGKTFSVYLNPFTYAASIGYRVLGIEGARLLPLLGALASLFAVGVLAGRLGLSGTARTAAVGVSLVATPLWFYGWVFWEHAPALACSLAATCLLVRPGGANAGPGALLAGALLGLGTALRPEMAVYAAALALAVAFSFRRYGGPALAAAGGVAAFALSLAILTELPISAFVDRILDATVARLPDADDPWASPEFRGNTFVFLYLGLVGSAWDFPPDAWLLLLGFTAAALLLAGFAGRRLAFSAQLVACAAGVAASATAFWAIRDESLLLAGLLTGVPFVFATLPAVGAAANSRIIGEASEDGVPEVARCLAWLTLLFTAVVSVSAPSGGGNQWGQRFLLPVIPLLVLLLGWHLHALSAAGGSRVLVASVAAAVLAGAFTQAVGVRNHLAMRRELAADSAAIGALPARYVLATEWYVPHALTLLVDTHDVRLLLTADDGDVQRAVDALARSGEDSFVLIRSAEEPAATRYGDYRLGETRRFDLVPSKLVAREFRREP